MLNFKQKFKIKISIFKTFNSLYSEFFSLNKKKRLFYLNKCRVLNFSKEFTVNTRKMNFMSGSLRWKINFKFINNQRRNSALQKLNLFTALKNKFEK